MDAVVVARALAKRFAGSSAPAVDGIAFEVRDGECFGFLGPNGAGKTTTMRMIACIAQRTGGELRILGRDPQAEEREIKARIGVIPQETNLDTVISVRENLAIYASYFGIPYAEARTITDALLDFVQLSDRADWHVERLSGGMKRRLLIARGLVNEPELLVLDEPTAGLDPQARHLVWEKLRELKRSGVTLVITTHYMEEAAQLCDRLVIMHQGRILVEGAPHDLVRRYVAPQVVELTSGDRATLERLARETAAYASADEIVADRLVLHTDDGEAMLKVVNDAGIAYESATLRPATLEDVFLELAGRRLEE